MYIFQKPGLSGTFTAMVRKYALNYTVLQSLSVAYISGSFQPLQILEFIAWSIPTQILIKEYKANTFLSEAIYVKLYPF